MELREKNRHLYWSKLYKALWSIIRREVAVYRRELEYRMEELGFPPMDTTDTVKNFVSKGFFHEERRSVRFNRRTSTLVFYVYKKEVTPSGKLTERAENIINKKIELQRILQRIPGDKKEEGMLEAVTKAAHQCGYTIVAQRTQWFNGKAITEGDIDLIIYTPGSNTFWGAECKNKAEIIDITFMKRKLLKHFKRCEILGLTPIFILSRVFNNVKEHLEKRGAVVIETEFVFYSDEVWKRVSCLRNELGYYFIRKSSHGKVIGALSKKLCSLDKVSL